MMNPPIVQHQALISKFVKGHATFSPFSLPPSPFYFFPATTSTNPTSIYCPPLV